MDLNNTKIVKDEKSGKVMLYMTHREDNIVDGIMYQFRNDGTLEAMCNYKNGIKDGRQTFYFENGNIQYIQRWENGLMLGPQYEYWNNIEARIKIFAEYRISVNGKYSQQIIEIGYDEDGKENHNYNFIEKGYVEVDSQERVL